MSSIKKEFEEFMKWMHQPDVPSSSESQKFANIVWSNFDSIAKTTRNKSQRSILLAQLAQPNFAQQSDTLPVFDVQSTATTWPWKKLSEIKIGPFRGFRYSEPFDIKKRIILLYGPNGSGKTSFCEALEFCLTGSVEEADAKRISGDTYLSNIHERKFETPILTATSHAGKDLKVIPNPDSFRFCFVEKNRIDSFSRIAARPPGQQTELIATLFGLDKFSEFVGNFNESLDKQLTLTPIKQIELDLKRATLSEAQLLVASESTRLSELAFEELTLAKEYQAELDYSQLKALFESSTGPSRLQVLNDQLNATPPPVYQLSSDEIQQMFADLKAAQEQLDLVGAEMASRAVQLSFTNLYTAILALETFSKDICPACDTPLAGENKVVSDPFIKAKNGLADLAELALMQEKQKQLSLKVDGFADVFRMKLLIVGSFLKANADLNISSRPFFQSLSESPNASWWRSVTETDDQIPQDTPSLAEIINIAQKIDLHNQSAQEQLERRHNLVEERERILQFQLKVSEQDGKRLRLLQDLASAKSQIELFDEANKDLISEVNLEKSKLASDALIKVAYDAFLVLLKKYLDELPSRFISGLNEQALRLYNDFNTNDLDVDKLDSLHLPLKSDQKIEVSFRGNPNQKVDALRILSEGHIRCLGLAILLAKNLQIGSPLLIFDDAINAIDHDHRRGIRETIFQSDYFAESQIIVTCHSNEFIKDIQQSLGAHGQNICKSYVIQGHSGNYQPRVNGSISSRNYVAMARAARNELNDREALDSARKALEASTEKIWRWLASYDHGLLSVQLNVGSEPQLRHLCDALRKRLNDTTSFSHCEKEGVNVALSRILGIPEKNMIWIYLNKGTHEEADRDDFDGAEVEIVVQTLEQLDALSLKQNK